MTSILTNSAAMAALQTLRTVGSRLDKTQMEISSGLRIKTAADNAAYWSISTTMRSDNMAVSAVADALGLGAATTDTAYAGTSAIVDILGEFKARLVAAREPGVDKSKIQKELAQLNAQAESIVASSSFNSVNWLATSAPSHLGETGEISEKLVSSFIRSQSGNVAVGTLNIDLRDTSMLNVGGGGILQKGLWSTRDIGGFRGTGINSVAHQGHEMHDFTGPATFGPTDFIEFDVTVDAGTHSAGTTFTSLRIDKSVIDAALGTTDGIIHTAAQMRDVLNQVFLLNAVPAPANETLFSGSTSSSSAFEIASLETSGHAGSSIDVANVTSSLSGGFALGLEDAPSANHDNMYPQASIGFTKPFYVRGNAQITFDVQVGPGALQTYTIDRAAVDAALGTSDGRIANAADLAAVITHVTAGSGLAAVTSGSAIVLGADQSMYPEAGNRAARVYVNNVQSYPEWSPDFDLAEIDVTDPEFDLDEYIRGVEYMLNRAISSASTLGSTKTRIDMQADFAQTLMATIDKGIGRLVDADMNEASTRLKALQTQQQLAVQALQIANSNSENVMQLFR